MKIPSWDERALMRAQTVVWWIGCDLGVLKADLDCTWPPQPKLPSPNVMVDFASGFRNFQALGGFLARCESKMEYSNTTRSYYPKITIRPQNPICYASVWREMRIRDFEFLTPASIVTERDSKTVVWYRSRKPNAHESIFSRVYLSSPHQQGNIFTPNFSQWH